MKEKIQENLTRLPTPEGIANGGQVNRPAPKGRGSLNEIERPPVVVIMGHIDHGKTSILDFIRKTRLAEKETGGITQHIGAYQIEKDGKKITFIDTPGHEAFSAIRARGAKVADIVVLVVDITQGVQAQTKEAILQAKKEDLPFIVALHKIDRPEANPEKVKGRLQKEGILVEDLGGKIPSVKTSAVTGQGIEELLEIILLVAEMEGLKADLSKSAEGAVIESYLDFRRGPAATLIVKEGILKENAILATPSTLGKIKRIEDFQGRIINQALPSDPAVVIGFENVPKVGEKFKVFPEYEIAKTYLKKREEWGPEVISINPGQKVLNLILKSDVLGSSEAIETVLKNLPQDKVILRILKSDVGDINENDLKLAQSGKATILGFRVKINPVAKKMLEREKLRILTFDLIYDLVEATRKLMEKSLQPERVRIEIAKVKVLVDFWAEKSRQIVGGKVIKGEVKGGSLIEVFRPASSVKQGEGEEIVGRGKMINLQINKKDVERVLKGQECGILYEGKGKIEKGDILVIYTEKEQKNEI